MYVYGIVQILYKKLILLKYNLDYLKKQQIYYYIFCPG